MLATIQLASPYIIMIIHLTVGVLFDSYIKMSQINVEQKRQECIQLRHWATSW